jgi:hypothetical protein
MRLTHFAFALTFLLLCITGYLAWEGQEAKRGAMNEVALLKKKQEAREMASPNVSSMMPLPSAPAASITPPAPGAIAAPSPPSIAPPSPPSIAATSSLPGGGLTVPTSIRTAEAKGINTNTLTPLQKQVQDAKPIAKVKTVVKEQGFVIIDAGSKQGIQKGLAFDIRRGDAVLAKVRVTETVEENESVADLDLASIPAGVSIEPGDEIIQPVGR